MAPRAELEQLEQRSRLTRFIDQAKDLARPAMTVLVLAVGVPAAAEGVSITAQAVGIDVPGFETPAAFADDSPPAGSHVCNQGEPDVTGHGTITNAAGNPVSVLFCSDAAPNGPSGGGGPKPVDLCSDIPGNQTVVPKGRTRLKDGTCPVNAPVASAAPPKAPVTASTLAPDVAITVNNDEDTLSNNAIKHGNGDITVTPAAAVTKSGECLSDPFPDIPGLTEKDYNALVAELPTLSSLTWSPQDLCNVQGGGLVEPYASQLAEARVARDAAIQAAADKAVADKAAADKAAADKIAADEKAAVDKAAADAAAATTSADPCAVMGVDVSTPVAVSAQQQGTEPDLNPQAINAVKDAGANVITSPLTTPDRQTASSTGRIAAAAALKGSNNGKGGNNDNGVSTMLEALIAAEAIRRGARHFSSGKAAQDPGLAHA